MGEVTRTTENTDAPDAWSGGELAPAVAPGPQDTTTTDVMNARRQAQDVANDQLGWAMHQIAAGVQVVQTHLAKAMEKYTDELDYAALAQTVDWLQTVKRTLGEAESYTARELGRMDSTPEFIELPDGRRAEVMKGRERKEWRHEDWKRDVRAKIVDELGYADLVTATGEVVQAQPVLADLIAKAQAVHGAAAPKVTALKPLGLAADDYCTSGPGPYAVKISAPAAIADQEN